MTKKSLDLNKRRLIVGVGSALIDILVHESDQFLTQIGVPKGGMQLVEFPLIKQTLAQTDRTPQIVPGGSACNTVIGVGKLGGQASFVGQCGRGDYGRLFEDDLQKNNVKPKLVKSALPTGRVVSIITPDAQRSMLTYLGASAEMQPQDMTAKTFQGAAVVHIEGYLLFNADLITATMKAAKAAGALVALDLASYTVVETAKELLQQLVREYVDILIANEDEARAYTGHTDETKAVAALSQAAPLAVLKVGPRGSYIARDKQILRIDPVSGGQAIDTTGAGDLWAAGFLYGFVNGYTLKQCGALGSLCGYEVCQVVGADIPDQGWQRIRQYLETGAI